MESGLSFIICCYNSAGRLSPTLTHLAAQNIPPEMQWEVVVIDNASTDGTAQAAASIWERLGKPAPMRIVLEPQLGVGYARYRGILAAKYEFLSFIDDDNWVDPAYALLGFDFMQRHPDAGACGSLNEAISDIDLPWWFENFHRSYAVGPQSETAGDITANRGVLWSAGLLLRRSAVSGLLDAGFRPMVVGARGEKVLMRSEDYEMCMALRLRGWRLWYEPKLKLKHYLPAERLDWNYLRRLIRGVGTSDLGLRPYYLAASPQKDNWRRLTVVTVLDLMKRPGKLFLSAVRSCEGDRDVLSIERSIGRLATLIRIRQKYDRMFVDFNQSGWIIHTPPLGRS